LSTLRSVPGAHFWPIGAAGPALKIKYQWYSIKIEVNNSDIKACLVISRGYPVKNLMNSMQIFKENNVLVNERSDVLRIVRIGIFYDGQYFFTVSNYYKYEHQRKSRISITGLHDYIRKEVAELLKVETRNCQIIDAHYFIGRNTGARENGKLENERAFEDVLMRENIVSHYLPLQLDANGVRREKGIDVWLALEAYEMAVTKSVDILVLIAGDGDYVPLVRKLHTVGTQTLLAGWNFVYHNENGDTVETRVSKQLMDEVFLYISMDERIQKNDDPMIRKIFLNSGGNDEREREERKSPEKALLHGVSTIFDVKNGFGFIKDEEKNNIFFHYNNLVNYDFSLLKKGMRVQYDFLKDEEKSETDGVVRFKAVRVEVLDD
jgi:uncharacterized LabA/DUF88 family protein/cold shock CspA family protein